MNEIKFSKQYTKLIYPRFPTIRGKSNYPLSNGIYMIHDQGWHFGAKLIYQKVMRIRNIPHDFLNWDFAPHLKIESGPCGYLQACRFLNQFRRGHFLGPSDEVLVLIFEKLESNTD